MVVEFEFLSCQPFATSQAFGFADVVVRAHEEHVARLTKKRSDGGDLCGARLLPRSRRVKADDNERIGTGEKFGIERVQTGISPAFRAPDRISRPRGCEIGEVGEIRELYVVEKTPDALIELHRDQRIARTLATRRGEVRTAPGIAPPKPRAGPQPHPNGSTRNTTRLAGLPCLLSVSDRTRAHATS